LTRAYFQESFQKPIAVVLHCLCFARVRLIKLSEHFIWRNVSQANQKLDANL